MKPVTNDFTDTGNTEDTFACATLSTVLGPRHSADVIAYDAHVNSAIMCCMGSQSFCILAHSIPVCESDLDHARFLSSRFSDSAVQFALRKPWRLGCGAGRENSAG